MSEAPGRMLRGLRTDRWPNAACVMRDRSTILPLALGFVLAVGLHVLAAPGLLSWLDPDQMGRIMRVEPADPRSDPPLEPKRPMPGQADPGTSTVNLLSHEDYRKLIARDEAPFDQPTTQRQVEPAPSTERTPLDPTPPDVDLAEADPSPPAPPPSPAAPTASVLPPMPTGAPAGSPLVTEVPSPRPDLIEAPRAPEPQPAAAVATARPNPQPAERPREPAPPAPAPAAADEARPTVAPRARSESPPAARVVGLNVQPGEVVSRRGYKINTIAPRFGIVALRTTRPKDPIVTIVFDANGEVAEAVMTRSSGYPNVDSPILNAIYKWTAEGENLPPQLVLEEVNIILGVEQR